MVDFHLRNKRILFFSPKFFEYEMKIKEKLEQMGSTVDFYDERPSNTFFTKALLRIDSKFLTKLVNEYYKSIIDKVKENEYDYIFFIKGESVTIEVLKMLRENFQKCKMILYLWDSVKNIKNIDEKLNCFDEAFTFDIVDAKRFNSLKFRPLFYLDEYSYQDSYDNYKYDCCFIGTIHTDRYTLIKKIKNDLESRGLNTFFYMYIPAKQLYYFRKIFNSSFRRTSLDNFHFSPISSQEIRKTILSSRSVLDIQHPNQNGLTMRTIEMLGMRKKLITTNYNVKEYDFFNEKNIVLIDRSTPVIEDSFFENKYVTLDGSIYNNYSLEFWIKEVFSLK